ncbi:MAG: dihydroneopterin aldolase [Flavobacteriales bacterium]|jgi:dihydroneopterin aldolase
MAVIRLNTVRVHANHGCWDEEAIIGGEYTVDVALHLDFTEAAKNDDLSKTVDYVRVKEIVYEEMATRAKLIENVLDRMMIRLKSEFTQCDKIWIRVTKINAPMGGQVESVSVEMEA